MMPNPIPVTAATVCLLITALPIRAEDCADLTDLHFDTASVTAAEIRQDVVVQTRSGSEIELPAHCRVVAVLRPSGDSHIEMELWLPEDWNGRFLAVGNGGWAGSISVTGMAAGLESGYAVASNDTGHKGGSASFAVGHPEKVVDFAWRAMHEMVLHSRRIIAARYDQPPRRSWYQGCSTGGRQGMVEAQRFPDDFDGLIIGAPVYDMLTMNATQLHSMKTLIQNRNLALSPEKKQLLHDAVLAACDADDGVVDGILNDPLTCSFDPTALQCSAGGSRACLTSDEVSSVAAVYDGVRARDGSLLYPGHAKGFELGWRIPAEGSEPTALQSDATRYLAYEDAGWDWREFELERDLERVLEKAAYIEAVDPDLAQFKARGGKIIFYHGWNDPGPSPLNTIGYYRDVHTEMGPDQDDWLRLFMMPGMGHCGGGIGPDRADFPGALEDWVERGVAPDRIEAARVRDGRVEMTRPLCPFPQAAYYTGQGDTSEADSFECR